MALHGLFLAAQEACLIQQFGVISLSTLLRKAMSKSPSRKPTSFLVLLESVQDLLCRRQVRTMVIIDPADRPEEIAEIIPLGETGQLGRRC